MSSLAQPSTTTYFHSTFSSGVNSFKSYIEKLSPLYFKELHTTEELSLTATSELSTFIRFNHSKVRQNTTVHQHLLVCNYQKDKKAIEFIFALTLDISKDLDTFKNHLKRSREQIEKISETQSYIPIVSKLKSEATKTMQRPADDEIISWISKRFESVDMVGFWCSGPVVYISANHLGQFHSFETDYFFFDYSVYNGNKAAKGLYSSEIWDYDLFDQNIKSTINKLNLLNRPVIPVKKGEYNSFLEPMAVDEILSSVNWGGLSHGAYKQGLSPLKKLIEQEVSLSEKFSLSQNFGLGYAPQFNNLGEVAPTELALIENGKVKNLLTSTATANEYALTSNFATSQETSNTLEIKPGHLEKRQALSKLDTGLYLSNLHYINWSDRIGARLTGMTRFACFWVQHGEIQGPIQDLRFDDSVYNLFGSNLMDLTQERELLVSTGTYNARSLGANKIPGMLIKNMNFTL